MKKTLTSDQIQKFHEDGYLLVKGLFTPEEIEKFRKGCAERVPGDTLANPTFEKFSLSDKVLGVVRSLLGDEIVYPCLSQTRVNDIPKRFGSRYFHVDSFPDDLNYNNFFPILNTGIYLQDHAHYSGGLKILPKSHNFDRINIKTVSEWLRFTLKALINLDFKKLNLLLIPKKSVNVPTQAGDFLIWTTRVHHSGYAKRLKFAPNFSLPPILENWIPNAICLPEEKERRVVLSVYTKPCAYSEKYIELQITKEYRRGYYLGNAALLKDDVQEYAKSQGVEIRNDGYYRFKKLENLEKSYVPQPSSHKMDQLSALG